MARPIMARLGWHHYYVARFNKFRTGQAEHMALWYLMLHLEFDHEHDD
jgi:hypothetical protein